MHCGGFRSARGAFFDSFFAGFGKFFFFGGADKYFLRRVPLRGFLKFFCYYIVIINFLLYN